MGSLFLFVLVSFAWYLTSSFKFVSFLHLCAMHLTVSIAPYIKRTIVLIRRWSTRRPSTCQKKYAFGVVAIFLAIDFDAQGPVKSQTWFIGLLIDVSFGCFFSLCTKIKFDLKIPKMFKNSIWHQVNKSHEWITILAFPGCWSNWKCFDHSHLSFSATRQSCMHLHLKKMIRRVLRDIIRSFFDESSFGLLTC